MIRIRMAVLIDTMIVILLLTSCAGTISSLQPSPTTSLVQTSLPLSTRVATLAPASTTANNSPTQPPNTEEAISTVPPENPLAPETNPLGDIPDSQVFIKFIASPGNYSLEVPEGWARTTEASNVLFVDKFDGVSVTLQPATSAPTAKTAGQNEIATLSQTQRAFKVGEISNVKLPGGQAVRITATANSDPDPVTGKQVRLEEEIYLFYNNGTLAMFQLWAPLGADNVDQWKRMVESFRWQ